MIRVGVIGCGYWGPNLVRTLNELEGVRLMKVADLRPGRLDFISKRYSGVQTTPDAVDILKDPQIDAVVIATPPETHFELGMEALDCGKHVLLEKPLTTTRRHADELVKFAAQLQRVLMAGHLFLYAPAVLQIQSLLERGELGDIYSISSTRANLGPPNPKLDVLWDLAPHDLSIILHLMKESPVEVVAQGASFILSGLAETVFLFLRFPSGRIAHVHVSWLTPYKTRTTQVICSKRVVLYDDMQAVHKLHIYDAGTDNRVKASATDSVALAYRPGSIWMPALGNNEPLRAECEDFLRCIQTGQQPVSDGRRAAEVVGVLEAASESLREATPQLSEERSVNASASL